MNVPSRDHELLSLFSRLADTLVDDFDVVDLMQDLVDAYHDLFGFAEAGILLSDGRSDDLEVVASTSEDARLLEVMQIAAHAGPCIDCFRTGEQVSVPDIAQTPPKWATFRTVAESLGVSAVHAIPMRLRDTTIGTVNLLRAEPGELAPADVFAVRALADVASIGVLQHRALRNAEDLARQLQQALDSRIVIEQAKGVVSHLLGCSVEDAFSLLRSYARRNTLPLRTVAARIVDRSLPPTTLLAKWQGR